MTAQILERISGRPGIGGGMPIAPCRAEFWAATRAVAAAVEPCHCRKLS